jgi:hypothetical protein
MRAALGGKVLDGITPELLGEAMDIPTTVPWVFFYVPFLAKDLDPYIMFLQFAKNYATNNEAANFYKDW